MANVKKLNWIHWAIQEGLNGNTLELERALGIVEDIREEYERRKKEKPWSGKGRDRKTVSSRRIEEKTKIGEKV